MTDHEFEDEILMAYADGELDAETAMRVAQAIGENAALAARLAVFTNTRDVLSEAAKTAGTIPVPDSLAERVQATIEASRNDATSDNVVQLADRRRQPVFFKPAAIAAGFATVGLITGLLVAPATRAPVTDNLQFSFLEGAGISDVLSRIPAGERTQIDGGEIEVIASFISQDETLCREFELDRPDATTVVAVACQEETGWRSQFAVVSASDDGTSFTPASSLETLDTYLSAIGAGAPLTLEEEAERLGTMRK